jgi:hypothetical protein
LQWRSFTPDQHEGEDVEQSFNTAIRIAAAAAFATIVAFTAWHVAEQPKLETAAVTATPEQPATADSAAAEDSETPQSAAQDTAPAEPQHAPAVVTDALPTEPDPSVADSGPATAPPAAESPAPAAAPTVATPPAADAEPAPRGDGPRYANVVPDRLPPRASAPSAPKSAPAARHRSNDQTVIHVRRLQTQLMVGALSCGRPRMQHNYNSFVAKFDRALKANGRELKTYFAARFGARGTTEMDAFLTKLSNELSLVSMRHVEFCERTDGLFDTVLALPTGEIEAFADRYMVQAVASRGGF